ncbi:MAG: hypothetical protein JNL67_12140 [Planctomycetaceae bacterium]|nr:hypothetical protein [Planctomycetaceae bacterium]
MRTGKSAADAYACVCAIGSEKIPTALEPIALEPPALAPAALAPAALAPAALAPVALDPVRPVMRGRSCAVIERWSPVRKLRRDNDFQRDDSGQG